MAVNPISYRLGYIRGWESNWIASKKKRDFANKIAEDLAIREFVYTQAPSRFISKVVIERTLQIITVTIHTARPGIMIGPGGTKVQELKKSLVDKFKREFRLNVYEIKNEDLDARLVAKNIASQLAARSSYKRVGNHVVESISRQGASIQVQFKGRLGGAEISRKEVYRKGKIPRHTLRADIDYALEEVTTSYGKISVKVWIYKRDVYGKRDLALNTPFLTQKRKRK